MLFSTKRFHARVVVAVVVFVAALVVVVFVVVAATLIVVVVVAVVRLKAINNSCAVCLFRLLSIVIGRQKWNVRQGREAEEEGERVKEREKERVGEGEREERSCPIAWSAAARSHKTRLKFRCYLPQVFLLMELKKCHMTLIEVRQG